MPHFPSVQICVPFQTCARYKRRLFSLCVRVPVCVCFGGSLHPGASSLDSSWPLQNSSSSFRGWAGRGRPGHCPTPTRVWAKELSVGQEGTAIVKRVATSICCYGKKKREGCTKRWGGALLVSLLIHSSLPTPFIILFPFGLRKGGGIQFRTAKELSENDHCPFLFFSSFCFLRWVPEGPTHADTHRCEPHILSSCRAAVPV